MKKSEVQSPKSGVEERPSVSRLWTLDFGLRIYRKMRRALRGEVDARTLALEAWRRSRASVERRRERAMVAELDRRPARLSREFARLSTSELLDHFRRRDEPVFFAGFVEATKETAALQRELFPAETARLIECATRIAGDHRWNLMGFGEKSFGAEINWQLDPLSNFEWPLLYHADMNLRRDDNSDVRVLWELNRLAHFITLGRAFAVTNDERFSAEFFHQLESWRAQNPVGYGANWTCAMEVALRSMNLLAAFELFRHSKHFDEQRLAALLAIFDQHGAHIRRNLEFSYISTSNHYLSDVVGLLWLGVMLPELSAAREWRVFALGEMLREMDKQVLADGADCEASTGYHRLVLELFLSSFILCRANKIEIEERYWTKLRAMLDYLRAYLRPDGRAPLIGDTDGGQVLPVTHRAADDHAYLLALGASFFDEANFKLAGLPVPEELLWILGGQGLRDYEKLETSDAPPSQAFEDAGTYIMRDRDLYLFFNASGNGLNGRGSHGHNDALSLEVAACGRAFIVDPGTYVYSHDLHARQLFRSTAFHSTVEVDGFEQNTTDESLPFIIGDEAHPRVLSWETTSERDHLIAEHDGYTRLSAPVKHRRTVSFDKRERYWSIEDTLLGEGAHEFRFRFHFADDLEVMVSDHTSVQAWDRSIGARLYLVMLDFDEPPTLEPRFVSRDYGAKSPSVSACWTRRESVPLIVRYAIVPVCASENEQERLRLVARLRVERRENIRG